MDAGMNSAPLPRRSNVGAEDDDATGAWDDEFIPSRCTIQPVQFSSYVGLQKYQLLLPVAEIKFIFFRGITFPPNPFHRTILFFNFPMQEIGCKIDERPCPGQKRN